MSAVFSRRRLFRAAGGAAAFGVGAGRAEIIANPDGRTSTALKVRMDAATAQAGQATLPQSANDDETALPRWAACFTKGLPTMQLGEAEPGMYETVLRPMQTSKHTDFEAIARVRTAPDRSAGRLCFFASKAAIRAGSPARRRLRFQVRKWRPR